MRLFLAVLVVGIAVAAGRAAHAGEALRSFAESDRNGDGSVDRSEMERRALGVFAFGDVERDGFLTRQEYGSLVADDPFANLDTNADGRIGMHEFLDAWRRDFQAADTNGDGVLSKKEAHPAVDSRP